MEKKLLKLLSSEISQERIRTQALEMNRLEGNCSHSNFDASTKYAMKCMKEAGFSKVERIALPADGKTAHFDCIMPQAWEMKGRAYLRLDDPALSMEERTLADTDIDPFNSGIWGCGTPGKKAVKCQIVAYDPKGEKDYFKGKLVLLEGFNRSHYKHASDSDALGVIISDSKGADEYPDHCRWSNGIGFCGWYHTAEDHRIVIFCITPRKAAFLRKKLLAEGPQTCEAFTPARIYEGEVYTVSGVIPGKSKEEMTFFAHMYEPFVADDAAGGIVAIEMCRALKKLIDDGKLPPLQRTLRVVLSMELYGFYQYFEKSENIKRTLSIFSFDSCCHTTFSGMPRMKLRHSSFQAPFFGDCLFEEYFRKYTPQEYYAIEKGSLSDDTFCSTLDWQIPSIWPHSSYAKYHHNAGPAFAEADFELAYDTARFMGILTGLLAISEKKDISKLIKKVKKLEKASLSNAIYDVNKTLNNNAYNLYDAAEKIRFKARFAANKLLSFNRFWKGAVTEEDTAVFMEMAEKAVKKLPPVHEAQVLYGAEKEADNLIVKRLRGGILKSLAAVPQKERIPAVIPNLLYMNLDGKKSLRQAMKEFQYDHDLPVYDKESYIKYMDYLAYLEKYGYVKLTRRKNG